MCCTATQTTIHLWTVKNVIYVGVFLNPEQQAKLLEAVPARHAKVHADHVTLVFRPSPHELEKYSLGAEVEFTVVGEVFDDKGQAVLVKGVDSKNLYPHITISTAPGIKPVYSNEA